MKDWDDLIRKIKKMKVGENIVFTHKSGIYNLVKTEDLNVAKSVGGGK